MLVGNSLQPQPRQHGITATEGKSFPFASIGYIQALHHSFLLCGAGQAWEEVDEG